MGATKYIEGIIVTSSGTITGQIYSKRGGTHLSTSGALTFTQFGDNPRNFRSNAWTDPATGSAKIILARNGGDFAEWDLAFPAVDTADVYEFQNSPNSNDIGQIQVQSNIVINPAQFIGGVQPGVIGIYRGDYNTYDLPLMGNISARTKLVLTAKCPELVDQPGDTDAQATFQIVEGVGLTILNGATAAHAGDATLTVSNPATGLVVLAYTGRFAAAIGSRDLRWDCQFIDSLGPHTPIGGTLSVLNDVTNAIT